jgi:hypothetical protein
MNTTIVPEGKTDIHLRLRLLREVASMSDGYTHTAQEFATKMESSRRPKITMTQVRGLENIAYTTGKVSDILDLIKNQVGRNRWPLELGRELLDVLSQRQAEARRIAQIVNPKDDDLPRRTYLLLCQEFIKHVAAHFVYQRKLRSDRGEEE